MFNQIKEWIMNHVVFIPGKEEKKSVQTVNDVYRLRHDAFIDRLGWDICSDNGMERDHFDDLDPYHIVVKNASGEMGGCWRALPTTGDYMLRSIFPELLQGEVLPECQNIWEISRFAVKKTHNKAIKGYSSQVTVRMLQSLYEFAQYQNVQQYVAVTTVGFERILQKLGITMRRLGEGKALQIGVEKSVAILVDVDEKLRIELH